MQVTNFAQPNPGVQVTAATNTAVNGNTEQLSNSVTPVSDRLSITSNKITLARQVVTQQIDIALQIKSPVNYSKHAGDDDDDQVDQLVNKVVQKIHDEKSAKAEDSSDDHHSAAVRSVRIKVAQGFENAVAVLSRSGNVDGPVANDVEQVRSRVDAAIDQVAGQSAVGGAETPAANVETTTLNMVSAQRDLSSSLQLTTRDGDVVTVNLSRSQALTAGSATGPGGSLFYAGAASSSLINVSVQGDLSEKENESIRKVVESINKLAEKMFSGNTGAAMEKLGELKINTEYLAGMSLSMSSSISYQAVSAYSQVSRLPDESAPAVQVSTAPSTPPAVNTANSVAAPEVTPVVNQSATPVVDAVGASAVPVVAEAATVVNDAVASDAFADPFGSVINMFAQISDMFSSIRGDVSNDHKDFVNELFKGIVDKSEGEHGHDKKIDQDEDDVAVNNLAA